MTLIRLAGWGGLGFFNDIMFFPCHYKVFVQLHAHTV